MGSPCSCQQAMYSVSSLKIIPRRMILERPRNKTRQTSHASKAILSLASGRFFCRGAASGVYSGIFFFK